MELAAAAPQRVGGLDLIAAHLASLDPDTAQARERLEHKLGSELASLLVAALAGRRRDQAEAA
jgi:hypothetical protein